MKKTLDLKKLMQEAEERGKKGPISTDKEVRSEFLKVDSLLGQADDKNYASLVKNLKKPKV